MVRSASCGQRWLALARSRCRNEVLVDSGGVGTVSMMLVADARRVVAGTDRWRATNDVCLCRALIRLFFAMDSGGCCWPGPVESAGSIVTCCALGSCWPPPTARPMPRSAGPWVSVMTPSVSGGAGSAGTASTVLRDRPRTGRPHRFPAAVVAEVKALACELPANCDVPLAKWSCPDLAVEAARRGVVESVSASTVRRWLSADALKPWQHRSWIFPRDPHFAVKAARVLDLYARVFDGEPLGENDYVLSADEKPGVQARSRIHPSRPPGPGRRPMRVESEYRRHGTLAYLAAYDVHRAHVIGHCAPSTGIEPFTALVDKVMTRAALRGVVRRQRFKSCSSRPNATGSPSSPWRGRLSI